MIERESERYRKREIEGVRNKCWDELGDPNRRWPTATRTKKQYQGLRMSDRGRSCEPVAFGDFYSFAKREGVI